MELAAFLIVLGVFLICLKLFGVVFKAGIFLLSIPFMILGGIVLTVIFFAIFPVALVAGLLSVILIPLTILGPALPLILLGLIIFAITR